MATPDTCPNCGADVPPKAKACPVCGACEQTGWSEDAETGDLGLPEESFNYDEFVQREFGAKRLLPRGITWFWWGLSILLAACLAWFFLR